MKVVCAWCGAAIREVNDGTDHVSHGICAACCRKVLDDDEQKDCSGVQPIG